MENSDEAAPARGMLDAPRIPDLSPRAWWFYLALAEPQSLEELVATSGLVEGSVRRHLRKLSSAGLVRTTSSGRYVHAASLPPASFTEITERVATARLSSTQAAPTDVKHEAGFHSPVQRGGAWHTLVRCACGWRQEVVAGDAASATVQAKALWKSHAPSDEANWSRKRFSTNAALTAVALAIVLLVGFVGVNLVQSLFDPEENPDNTTYNLPQDTDGVDCDKAVTYLMTREYGGGWGSGKWPTGEYPERVRQCEGG